MTDNIITPVGRFVSGSLTEKRTTDHMNRPKPEDKHRFEFGVAFRKDAVANAPALSMPELLKYVQGVAMAKHAHLSAVQQFKLDGYSWKIKDGDAPNRENVVNENTAGCWVFYFASGYPIRTCDQSNAEIPGDQIKRGYYVDLVMNAASNGLSGGQEGVYLNPVWVRMVAFGEEIRGGVDAKTAFGGAQPAQLPPGASATPLPGSAPSGAMMAGNGSAGAVPATPHNMTVNAGIAATPANAPATPSLPGYGHGDAGNPAPAPGAAQPAPNPAASPLPGPTAFPGDAQAAPAPHHGFVDNATAAPRGPGIPS